MTDAALIRIEYKLDLIIRALQDKGLMIEELPDLKGIESDTCPVCEQQNRVNLDLKNERLTKSCGCDLPKAVVAGISALLTPAESEEHYGHRARNAEEGIPSDAAEEGTGIRSGRPSSGSGD